MLKATGLKKSYDELAVLKEVTIEVSKGEVVAIVGSSGAGKSTLLHILGTLDSADSGSYLIGDKDVFSLNEKQLAKFRNEEIGFIFQFHHLLPEFTALENVCIPAFLSDKSKQNAEFRALELLDFLGLKDRINHKPAQLSGGEQQRVAIARAIAMKPELILADEPTGNLDTENSVMISDILFKYVKEEGSSLIMVTHDPKLANKAKRKIRIKDGKIK